MSHSFDDFLSAVNHELTSLTGQTSDDFPEYNFEADFDSGWTAALSVAEAIVQSQHQLPTNLDYLTPDFVRHDCGVFGATLSDHDCDRIISQVHYLYSQGKFHHTGVYTDCQLSSICWRNSPPLFLMN